MSGQNTLAWPRPAKRRRANDRRASVRFAPTQEIVCYCAPAGARVFGAARVCDISAGGACLLVKLHVEVGDVVAVEMINGPHTFLCARTMRLVRVFVGSGDDAVIAGEFDRPLDYDELLPFIL